MWRRSKTHIYRCPSCSAVFELAQLNLVSPLECPTCGAQFRLKYKHNWAYGIVSAACALAIAYAQGSRSILFVGAALLYAPIIHIFLYRLADVFRFPIVFELLPQYIQTIEMNKSDDSRR